MRNKELELTIKLKGMGVERGVEHGGKAFDKDGNFGIVFDSLGVKEYSFEIRNKLAGRVILSKKILMSDKLMGKWDAESCLTWLRERGWKYGLYPSTGDDLKIVVYYKPIKKNEVYSEVFEKTVSPGHELKGLLECMAQICEGER